MVVDSSHRPLADAEVQLDDTSKAIGQQQTSASGTVVFSGLSGTAYMISVSKLAFQPVEKNDVKLAASGMTTVEITLGPALRHSDQVDVTASPDKVGQTSPGSQVDTAAARELPSRPATVSDALPLVPGITRSPQGGLNISGSGEHRSALIVNSADITDPATGQFGTTVPIDSVESLNVSQTSFLAEYGRFTSGLITVETRRGSDKWKWELNDPFPDFRIRSYHLMGIMDATPRINLEGPLIAGKLFFSQGFEYQVRKTEVITQSFPNNQRTTEGLNSFSQFDYVASANQLITATFHVAPQRMKSVNLDAFDPISTVPDASLHDNTVTIGDKLTIRGGDLFENTISHTSFDVGVWAHGTADLNITPEGNTGNYFAQQRRSAARESWLSTYTLSPANKLGVHNFKVGAYIAPSSEKAQIVERPFNILDSSAHLLQRVSFTGGSPIRRSDTEMAFFGQDHWLISPRLALDLGLRGESQQVTDTFQLAPRAGLAWMPSAWTGTVVRGGIGLFYDRVPLNVFGFSQYPNQVVTSYDGSGQVVGRPVTYLNALGQLNGRTRLIFRDNIAGNFSPRSTNWSLQVEQPVSAFLKLRATYLQYESGGLVVINPIAPAADSSAGTMLLTGTGRSRYHQLELTARVRLHSDRDQLLASYVRSNAKGDLNDFNNYLGSYPAPIIHPDQFGNLPADIPNRFLVWGLVHLPLKMQIAPIFEWRSGFPYTVTDAAQAYVGLPFSQRFPNFLAADARVSKDFKVNNKYTVRLSVTGNNLTDHFNPEAVYANTDAPLYGRFFGERHRRFLADFDVIF